MEHYLQDADAFVWFILSIIYIKSFSEARLVSGDQETKLCLQGSLPLVVGLSRAETCLHQAWSALDLLVGRQP